MRAVDLIDRLADVLVQLIGDGRQLLAAHDQEALQGSGAGGQLPRRPLRQGHLQLPGGGAGAGVAEGRGSARADQQRAVAGADVDAAVVAGADLHIEQRRQLVDQLALAVLRTGAAAAAGLLCDDVVVQLVDLREQPVHLIDAGADLAVGLVRQLLQLARDGRGLAEEALDVRHRLVARDTRGRVLGGGGDVGEGLFELAEIAGAGAGVAEQGLGLVQHGRHGAGRPRLGGGGEAGLLQELVDRAGDGADLDPAHELAPADGGLVDHLAGVTGRVDVGDVVRNDPELGLGGEQSRGRRAEDRIQRHGMAPLVGKA